MNPHLAALADVIAELVARELLEAETPSLPGKQDDGVEDRRAEHTADTIDE